MFTDTTFSRFLLIDVRLDGARGQPLQAFNAIYCGQTIRNSDRFYNLVKYLNLDNKLEWVRGVHVTFDEQELPSLFLPTYNQIKTGDLHREMTPTWRIMAHVNKGLHRPVLQPMWLASVDVICQQFGVAAPDESRKKLARIDPNDKEDVDLEVHDKMLKPQKRHCEECSKIQDMSSIRRCTGCYMGELPSPFMILRADLSDYSFLLRRCLSAEGLV